MKKITNHLSTYWYFYCLGIFVLVLIGELFFKSQRPRENQPTWNGLWIGKRSNSSSDILSQATQATKTENGDVYALPSEFKSRSNEVVIDGDQVVFIKEQVPASKNEKLSTYVQTYGNPDLELYETDISNAVRAHVFLDDGLVIIAHQVDGAVEQKWLFEPMSEEAFMTAWGAELENEPEGPEKAFIP